MAQPAPRSGPIRAKVAVSGRFATWATRARADVLGQAADRVRPTPIHDRAAR